MSEYEITLAAALAIGAGEGREATAAHPDCRCGKPKPPKPVKPDGPYDVDTWQTYWRALDRYNRAHGTTGTTYSKSQCPMHKSIRRR